MGIAEIEIQIEVLTKKRALNKEPKVLPAISLQGEEVVKNIPDSRQANKEDRQPF
jgi:hypothetical protein